MSSKINIIGAGGHAISIADAVFSCGYEISAFYEENSCKSDLLGSPVISSLDLINWDYEVVVAIGDNFHREKVYDYLVKNHPLCRFATIVHRTAYISESAKVGKGSVILANAFIGPLCSVGDFSILNTGSILEHESHMADFSSLGPNASTGGKVEIGRSSVLSINSSVKHAIKIGKYCVVGANSFVNKDISDGFLGYGVPFKVIKRIKPGFRYL